MSKITNDGLTWSGTECFIAVPVWQQWASKGFYEGMQMWKFSSKIPVQEKYIWLISLYILLDGDDNISSTSSSNCKLIYMTSSQRLWLFSQLWWQGERSVV